MFVVISIGTLAAWIKNLNKWAAALQQFYIREAERAFGNSSMWKRRRSLTICKVHIIFLAFMAIVLVFYLCFGTIYSR
jgi:hypothetical protein